MKRTPLFFLLLGISFMVTRPLAWAEGEKGVAVYPFGAKGGASPAMAEGLTALFISEIANVQGVRIVAEDIIEDLAKQLGLEQACGTESCQIDLAKQARAEYLVRGDVTQLGQTYFLTVLVIAIATNQTVFSDKLEASEAELVEQTSEMANRVSGFFSGGAVPQTKAVIDIDAKLREARRREASRNASPAAFVWLEFQKVSDLNEAPAVSANDKVAAWNVLARLHPDENVFRKTATDWMAFWRVPANREQSEWSATALYERACGANNFDACTHLGALREQAEDAEAAKALYERACEGGDLGGCYRLGLYLHERAHDWEAAEGVWRAACEKGEPRACNGMGWISENHKGEWKAAGKYYKRACKRGDLRGCNSLGYLYEMRTENWKAARALYGQACEGGVMSACYGLGQIMENRENNWRNARVLYQKACEGGVPYACDALDLGGSSGR